jgi:hypothetical protein
MVQTSSGAAATTFNSTMTAVKAGYDEAHVTDMYENVILTNQRREYKTTTRNSINIINQVQTGIYTVQVMHNDEIVNTRVSVIK